MKTFLKIFLQLVRDLSWLFPKLVFKSKKKLTLYRRNDFRIIWLRSEVCVVSKSLSLNSGQWETSWRWNFRKVLNKVLGYWQKRVSRRQLCSFSRKNSFWWPLTQRNRHFDSKALLFWHHDNQVWKSFQSSSSETFLARDQHTTLLWDKKI